MKKYIYILLICASPTFAQFKGFNMCIQMGVDHYPSSSINIGLPDNWISYFNPVLDIHYPTGALGHGTLKNRLDVKYIADILPYRYKNLSIGHSISYGGSGESKFITNFNWYDEVTLQEIMYEESLLSFGGFIQLQIKKFLVRGYFTGRC